jgi:hypothetical protein
MTSKISLGRFCAFVLLLLGACKGSSTETAAEAAQDDDDGIRVLDAGARPRSELRYRIAEGTTTTSTTTFRVATLATTEDRAAVSLLPGLRLDVVSGPAEVTDRGIRAKVDVVNAQAVIPEGFDPELAQQLRDGATIVDDMGGWFEIDDRGNMLAGELNEQTKRANIPVRLLRMILNTRQTLTRVRLPEDELGLGARWETRQQINAYGFEVQQVNTYTLVDRVGGELMLNVTVQQLAKPQTIEFPEEGIEISVDTMTAQADGQIILDLDALESDASANGTADDTLYVKTVDGTEKIEINEEFEVQIANTSGM